MSFHKHKFFKVINFYNFLDTISASRMFNVILVSGQSEQEFLGIAHTHHSFVFILTGTGLEMSLWK